MSQMWVFVAFEEVRADSTPEIAEGNTAIILAKHDEASPGYDLVAMGPW